MNILFTINKNFIDKLIDCIHSIERFQGEYDIYVVHSELNEEDISYIQGAVDKNVHIKNVIIDENTAASFPVTDRYPKEIYYRIFAPMLLPENVKRILYLDADTVVINPLDELYNIDFEGAYFIGCTHIKKFLTKLNSIRLGEENMETYINTGVMVMNAEALRKNLSRSQVENFVESKGKRFILPDQDIISALYGEKIKLVDSMLYNLSDRTLNFYNADPKNKKRDLDWVRKNTVVIHYFGKQKPWNDNYRGVLDIFYKELKESYEEKSK